MFEFLGSFTGDGGSSSGFFSTFLHGLMIMWAAYYLFIILAIVAIILMFIFMPKHCKRGIHSFYTDLFLSLLDEPLVAAGGAGLFFEPGDWLAAIIILFNNSKQVGWIGAMLMAWWASGFFPVNFIPGVGEAVGQFCNFVPGTVIIFCLFNKYSKANKLIKRLYELVSPAKAFGVKSAEKVQKAVQEAQEDLNSENPVGAVGKLSGLEGKVVRELHGTIDDLYKEVRKIAESEDSDARDQAQTIIDEAQKEDVQSQNMISPGVEKIVGDIENFEEHYKDLVAELERLVKKMHWKKLSTDEYLQISQIIAQIEELEQIFNDEFTQDEDQLLAA